VNRWSVVDVLEAGRELKRLLVAPQRPVRRLAVTERLLVEVLIVEDEAPGVTVDHIGQEKPAMLVDAELHLEVVQVGVLAHAPERRLEHEEGPERDRRHLLHAVVVAFRVHVLVVETREVGILSVRLARPIQQDQILDDLGVRVVARKLENLAGPALAPRAVTRLQVELDPRRIKVLPVGELRLTLQNRAAGLAPDDDLPRQHPAALGNERDVVVVGDVGEWKSGRTKQVEHVDRSLVCDRPLAGDDLVPLAVAGSQVVFRRDQHPAEAEGLHKLGLTLIRSNFHGFFLLIPFATLVHQKNQLAGLYHSPPDTKRAGVFPALFVLTAPQPHTKHGTDEGEQDCKEECWPEAVNTELWHHHRSKHDEERIHDEREEPKRHHIDRKREQIDDRTDEDVDHGEHDRKDGRTKKRSLNARQ